VERAHTAPCARPQRIRAVSARVAHPVANQVPGTRFVTARAPGARA
jgi:hypothetical protein